MARKRGQLELKKKDIRLGGIFWLRENAIDRDLEAFDRSGLQEDALGHPVVIIDTLAWRLGYVWVCVIRGTYRRWRGDIPVAEPQHLWDRDEVCNECETQHQYDPGSTDFMNSLTLEATHVPGKLRHVASREVFEVSVAMLRLSIGATEVGDHKFDKRSVDLLRDRAARSMRLLTRRSFALAQLTSQTVGDAEETSGASPSASNTTNPEPDIHEGRKELTVKLDKFNLADSASVAYQDREDVNLRPAKDKSVDAMNESLEGWTMVVKKKAERRSSGRRDVSKQRLMH